MKISSSTHIIGSNIKFLNRRGMAVSDICKTDKERISDLEAAVRNIQTDIALVVDILKTIKAGVKFFFVIGMLCKWVGRIALGVAALAALITFAKTGIPPQIHLD